MATRARTTEGVQGHRRRAAGVARQRSATSPDATPAGARRPGNRRRTVPVLAISRAGIARLTPPPRVVRKAVTTARSAALASGTAAGAALRASMGALMALPERRARLVAAFSAGLSVGLCVAGAPRVAVVAAGTPAVVALAAAAD